MLRIFIAVVCLLFAVAGLAGLQHLPPDATSAYLQGRLAVLAFWALLSAWLFVTGVKVLRRRTHAA
jgi:hypothetical protein